MDLNPIKNVFANKWVFLHSGFNFNLINKFLHDAQRASSSSPCKLDDFYMYMYNIYIYIHICSFDVDGNRCTHVTGCSHVLLCLQTKIVSVFSLYSLFVYLNLYFYLLYPSFSHFLTVYIYWISFSLCLLILFLPSIYLFCPSLSVYLSLCCLSLAGSILRFHL